MNIDTAKRLAAALRRILDLADGLSTGPDGAEIDITVDADGIGPPTIILVSTPGLGKSKEEAS